MKIRETILRPLENEPDPIVRVDGLNRLGTDVEEYVLTEHLAAEFASVLDRVVGSVRPGSAQSPKVGVWVSGFFGSGKSHFAKIVGHLLADTPIGGDTVRGRFGKLLHQGSPSDERVAELLQQALTHRLTFHLVTFDITRLQFHEAEGNVGLVFLRAFYRSLGFSSVIPLAQIELQLSEAGQYDEFVRRYNAESSSSWPEERETPMFALAPLSRVLPSVLPKNFPTAEEAARLLDLGINHASEQTSISDVVRTLIRWTETHPDKKRIMFVADEVGAWASGNLRRIEDIRAFVEEAEQSAQGRIWVLATSQEKLSDLGRNATDDLNFLQRLEARFQTNVHLESSEVGTVIETRILKKKPGGDAPLSLLWDQRQQVLRDIAEPPGLEIGGDYPRADKDAFIRDYPFLPYQLPAAADLFGGMRGVKISSGARSMIKVAFDALRDLGDRDIGAVVSWDQVFDSANSDNEFADEQYLGSQGLTYLLSADQHVPGTDFGSPSRILKALWLVQQSSRIPRTARNLARLLTSSLDEDVLLLERQVLEGLEALEKRQFVRREVGTDQWKFLTQDEVTVEKIVTRIAEDLQASRIRREITDLSSRKLQATFNARITHGVSNTTFDYGVSFGAASLRNQDAEVQLKVLPNDSPAAPEALANFAATLHTADVTWVLPQPQKLMDRLRRAIAIEMLPDDEEFRRVATEKTRIEADKLANEAAELRRAADSEIEDLYKGGKLIYGGQLLDLDSATSRAKVDGALHDRIDTVYTRFKEGDKQFNATNVERMFNTPPSERAALDPGLNIFGLDGHVNSNNVLVEEVANYLQSNMKIAGADVAAAFKKPKFGWAEDLIRYVSAAMFLDGKISLQDRNGKTFDDPHATGARALFATLAFRSTRLLISDNPLTPAEVAAARDLLKALGREPLDGSEPALKEASLQVCSDFGRRSSLVEKAANFGFPLPSVFDGLEAAVDEVQNAGAREKVVRALLTRTDEFKALHEAFKKLEDFDKSHGFEQFRRSRELLTAAVDAGLKEDPVYGPQIVDAEEQTDILITERRVLDEWIGSYQAYRLRVLDAFREVYSPLRKAVSECSTKAHEAVLAMPEFLELGLPDRTSIRVEFLADGRPLQKLELPELRDEAQLLAASAQLTVSHLRLLLANLDAELGRAKGRVLEFHARMLADRGEKARKATWSPSRAFAGLKFAPGDEDKVDQAFDAEKETVKQLIRDGKTVEVL